MTVTKVRQINQHRQNLHQMMRYHRKKNVKSRVMEERQKILTDFTLSFTDETAELKDIESIQRVA